LVNGVRQVSRLQAQAIVSPVVRSLFAPQRSVQSIPRVQHQRGRIRQDVHDSAAARIPERRDLPYPARFGSQQESQVVPVDLPVRRTDPLADRHGMPEIERRAGHRKQPAGRNRVRVSLRILFGLDLQLMPQHIAGTAAHKVKVTVVSQIDRRRPIRGGRVNDAQRAVVRERIVDRRIDLPRIALVAVRAAQGKTNRRAIILDYRLRVPDPPTESYCAAVQMVIVAVEGQLIRAAVQFEPAVRDAKGHPPDGAAKIGALRFV
jgi:hypothetical protein